jgi:hypothetical protein
MNEALRDHVTSAVFVLHLGKTHIAALVMLDLELAHERNIDARKAGKLMRCDVTARNGLASRGLIVHVWPEHEAKYKRPDGAGRLVYSEDWPDKVKPAERWHITRAGRLVIELLQECGLYDEYAPAFLRLLPAAKEAS